MFVVIALQFITSDIKPQPDSDDDAPLPSLRHGELFEMILDESPASIITDQPEASCNICFSFNCPYLVSKSMFEIVHFLSNILQSHSV